MSLATGRFRHEVTVADATRDGAARLAAAGIENPRLEARILLAHALGCPSADLVREPAMQVRTAGFAGLLDRRRAREPLAYILGRREFWSLEFLVSPATLIPRPATETVVEAALVACPRPGRVLDLGTGTGCLLLSVLHERPAAFGVGVDISPEAAALAARNARRLDLSERTKFLCSDWAAALEARFDLVLSNPPYIRSADIPKLMPDVAAWEPRRALDGGPDGLSTYRTLLSVLPRLLTPSGVAVLELGSGQAGMVEAEAAARGLCATFRSDFAGITRAIMLRGPAAQKNCLADRE